jgi:hypothetical protein
MPRLRLLVTWMSSTPTRSRQTTLSGGCPMSWRHPISATYRRRTTEPTSPRRWKTLKHRWPDHPSGASINDRTTRSRYSAPSKQDAQGSALTSVVVAVSASPYCERISHCPFDRSAAASFNGLSFSVSLPFLGCCWSSCIFRRRSSSDQ